MLTYEFGLLLYLRKDVLSLIFQLIFGFPACHHKSFTLHPFLSFPSTFIPYQTSFMGMHFCLGYKYIKLKQINFKYNLRYKYIINA